MEDFDLIRLIEPLTPQQLFPPLTLLFVLVAFVWVLKRRQVNVDALEVAPLVEAKREEIVLLHDGEEHFPLSDVPKAVEAELRSHTPSATASGLAYVEQGDRVVRRSTRPKKPVTPINIKPEARKHRTPGKAVNEKSTQKMSRTPKSKATPIVKEEPIDQEVVYTTPVTRAKARRSEDILTPTDL